MKRKKGTGYGQSPVARKGASPARRDLHGRVHLVLIRDPGTGHEQVALRAPLFEEAWQNELAAGAANTARALLGDEPSLEDTAHLARSVMDSVSRLAEGLLARAPKGAVACQAGCDHCCYQAVSVTLPEALAILRHLQATCSSADLAQLTQHVAELHGQTRGLSPAERFSPDHPCPFLVVAQGRCSIYEVRPLPCRGMNSLDAAECARRLREPDARAAFLASGEGSHSFLEPIRAVHAVSAGIQLGLSELYRLDMRPLELSAVMHLLLVAAAAGEETLAADLAAWLAGQTPFEAAVRPEAETDRALQRLSGRL